MSIFRSDTKTQLVVDEIKKLILRNETCSKHELARRLMKKYPLQFLNIEQTRAIIRKATGSSGKAYKKVIDFPSNQKPKINDKRKQS